MWILPQLLVAVSMSSPLVGAVRGQQAPELRVEHFTLHPLEAPDGPAARRGEPEILGTARWTSGPGHSGGRYLELDLYFVDLDARIVSSEEHELARRTASTDLHRSDSPATDGGLSAKLVWREASAAGRRMFVVEAPLDPDAPWRWVDGSGRDLARGEQRFPSATRWPLAWVDRLRTQTESEQVPLFSPLARDVETVEATSHAAPGPAGLALRVARVRGLDGSTRSTFVFAGRALVAFRLSEGGPAGQRCGAEAYLAVAPDYLRAADAEPISASSPRDE